MRNTRSSVWRLGVGLICLAGFSVASHADVPQGYRVVQQVLVGDGSVLEVLEDLRITPQLHARGWGM